MPCSRLGGLPEDSYEYEVLFHVPPTVERERASTLPRTRRRHVSESRSSHQEERRRAPLAHFTGQNTPSRQRKSTDKYRSKSQGTLVRKHRHEIRPTDEVKKYSYHYEESPIHRSEIAYSSTSPVYAEIQSERNLFEQYLDEPSFDNYKSSDNAIGHSTTVPIYATVTPRKERKTFEKDVKKSSSGYYKSSPNIPSYATRPPYSWEQLDVICKPSKTTDNYYSEELSPTSGVSRRTGRDDRLDSGYSEEKRASFRDSFAQDVFCEVEQAPPLVFEDSNCVADVNLSYQSQPLPVPPSYCSRTFKTIVDDINRDIEGKVNFRHIKGRRKSNVDVDELKRRIRNNKHIGKIDLQQYRKFSDVGLNKRDHFLQEYNNNTIRQQNKERRKSTVDIEEIRRKFSGTGLNRHDKLFQEFNDSSKEQRKERRKSHGGFLQDWRGNTEQLYQNRRKSVVDVEEIRRQNRNRQRGLNYINSSSIGLNNHGDLLEDYNDSSQDGININNGGTYIINEPDELVYIEQHPLAKEKKTVVTKITETTIDIKLPNTPEAVEQIKQFPLDCLKIIHNTDKEPVNSSRHISYDVDSRAYEAPPVIDDTSLAEATSDYIHEDALGENDIANKLHAENESITDQTHVETIPLIDTHNKVSHLTLTDKTNIENNSLTNLNTDICVSLSTHAHNFYTTNTEHDVSGVIKDTPHVEYTVLTNTSSGTSSSSEHNLTDSSSTISDCDSDTDVKYVSLIDTHSTTLHDIYSDKSNNISSFSVEHDTNIDTKHVEDIVITDTDINNSATLFSQDIPHSDKYSLSDTGSNTSLSTFEHDIDANLTNCEHFSLAEITHVDTFESNTDSNISILSPEHANNTDDRIAFLTEEGNPISISFSEPNSNTEFDEHNSLSSSSSNISTSSSELDVDTNIEYIPLTNDTTTDISHYINSDTDSSENLSSTNATHKENKSLTDLNSNISVLSLEHDTDTDLVTHVENTTVITKGDEDIDFLTDTTHDTHICMASADNTIPMFDNDTDEDDFNPNISFSFSHTMHADNTYITDSDSNISGLTSEHAEDAIPMHDETASITDKMHAENTCLNNTEDTVLPPKHDNKINAKTRVDLPFVTDTSMDTSLHINDIHHIFRNASQTPPVLNNEDSSNENDEIIADEVTFHIGDYADDFVSGLCHHVYQELGCHPITDSLDSTTMSSSKSPSLCSSRGIDLSSDDDVDIECHEHIVKKQNYDEALDDLVNDIMVDAVVDASEIIQDMRPQCIGNQRRGSKYYTVNTCGNFIARRYSRDTPHFTKEEKDKYCGVNESVYQDSNLSQTEDVLEYIVEDKPKQALVNEMDTSLTLTDTLFEKDNTDSVNEKQNHDDFECSPPSENNHVTIDLKLTHDKESSLNKDKLEDLNDACRAPSTKKSCRFFENNDNVNLQKEAIHQQRKESDDISSGFVDNHFATTDHENQEVEVEEKRCYSILKESELMTRIRDITMRIRVRCYVNSIIKHAYMILQNRTGNRNKSSLNSEAGGTHCGHKEQNMKSDNERNTPLCETRSPLQIVADFAVNRYGTFKHMLLFYIVYCTFDYV